ncbi:MAG TPA: NAD(P)-dependent oxidoreductase [Candidatus Binatus sp.]|nr:NAD(P)-dependent oxidoreductase [Candidatus Binatus sp.]
MSKSITKVGFIGLGRMGEPIANNVLAAGFDLVVYDVREAALAKLVERGANAAHSPREVAQNVELIELVVVDDSQVDSVLTGNQGVFAGAHAGSIVAIHSTVLPDTVKRLAQVGVTRGIQVIDAPVSGGETGAREKSLCYMVGGDAALLERCREVFSTSASQIFHTGELGSGAAAKMLVQVVTCINMLAASEAELLADRCGLNFATMQDVLKASSGQSFVAENWLNRFKLSQDPMEIRRRRSEVFQKSLGPALELARQLGLSLTGAELAERSMARLMGIED